MAHTVKAWHFLSSEGKLRDGREAPPDGEWLRHEGNIKMCSAGLHASSHVADALRCAPGPIVCRVECRGDIMRENDKLVCRERRILWRADATEALWDHARYARSVLHLWEVVEDYLASGDEALRAAKAAAKTASWNPPWDAPWDASWAAARKAQRRDLSRRIRALEGR